MALLLMDTIPIALAVGEASKGLSPEQAELLARTAAKTTELAKQRFTFERANMEQYPDFYFFGAVVAEPGAECHSGWYAVSKFTLEVWDPYRCSRYVDAGLSKLQQTMRKDLGLTEKEYRRHQNDDPCLTGSPR